MIGVPDPKWGEVGKAFIVLHSAAAAAVTETELLAHCAASLARYKVPKSAVFVDSLPLSAAGKILKRELLRLDR